MVLSSCPITEFKGKIPTLRKRELELQQTVPVKRETATTPTSHSHPTKRKEGYGPNPAIIGALLLALPLVGILGYLIREPKVLCSYKAQ